jgi:hypothetical protein
LDEAIAKTFGLAPSAFQSPDVVDYGMDQRTSDEVLSEVGRHAMTKIVLPRSIHRAILEDLWSMNIHAASLFPGLDGFARSLRRHVRERESSSEYQELVGAQVRAILGWMRTRSLLSR